MSKERNKIIAANIKKYVKEKGITQKELANQIGISPSTMSDYMNLRSNPSHGVIQKIADYFGVLKSDIDTTFKDINSNDIYGLYNQLEKTRQKKVYNYAESQLEEQKQSKIVEIDDYRDIKIQSSLSAGSGIIDLDPEYAEDFRYKGDVPEHDLAFKVSGNSMEPFFQDEEIIFVKRIDEPRDGIFAAVMINDEAYIKKLYIEEDHLRLVSLNKEYKDIVTDKNDDVKIVGKVII